MEKTCPIIDGSYMKQEKHTEFNSLEQKLDPLICRKQKQIFKNEGSKPFVAPAGLHRRVPLTSDV